MNDDPIVAEVRAAREQLLASYGHDWMKLTRAVIERQKQDRKKHSENIRSHTKKSAGNTVITQI